MKEELDLILKPDKKRKIKNKKGKSLIIYIIRKLKKSKISGYRNNDKTKKIKGMERQFEIEYKSMKQSDNLEKIQRKNKKQKNIISKKEEI